MHSFTLHFAQKYPSKFTSAKLLAPLATALAALSLGNKPAQALSFNFMPTPGMDPIAIDGFAAAGQLWSSRFSDPVTINIDIGFSALGPNVLGQAASAFNTYSYSSVRNALINDRTSADDNTAVANLQSGSAFGLLINRTSNNPNGSGSATPYWDNDGDENNTTIVMTNANAKALGLLSGNASDLDASITFSNLFTWDFDRSNGIIAGAHDFIGVAAHEIGHVLGFISGVHVLDNNSPPVNGPFRDDEFIFVTTLDLYRYSTESRQLGPGIIDWTADDRDKYFSIDGGTTVIGAMTGFAEGVNFGDGRQASHWKDNLGLGIMDPTAADGELLQITARDEQALDVIGWDRANINPVPTPSLLPAVIGFTVSLLRKRKTQASEITE